MDRAQSPGLELELTGLIRLDMDIEHRASRAWQWQWQAGWARASGPRRPVVNGQGEGCYLYIDIRYRYRGQDTGPSARSGLSPLRKCFGLRQAFALLASSGL